MIQYIGLMVGLYILTRCTEIIFKKDGQTVAQAFAVITFLVTLFSLLGVITSWATIPKL